MYIICTIERNDSKFPARNIETDGNAFNLSEFEVCTNP